MDRAHPADTPAPPAPDAADEERAWYERWQLQERLTAWFDVGLGLLALVMLTLLIIELVADVSGETAANIRRAQTMIWALFVIAFAIEFTIAPSKKRYLRKNWIVALSIAIPALRIFRIVNAVRFLQATRALRGLNLARALAALNRAMVEVAAFLRTNQFGYVVALVAIVTVTAAALGYYLERGHADSEITTFGEALWWAATLVTTVNAQVDAVTFEGRIIALVLRVFGMAMIGYITATIAVFLLRRQPNGREPSEREQMTALRDELAETRRLLERSLGDRR
jgi:voltage-gated potassium channel